MKKAVVTLLVLAVLGGGGYGAYWYFYLGGQESMSGRVSSDSADAIHVDSVGMITGLTSTGLTDRYGGETVAQATLEVKQDSDREVEECFVKEGDEVEEGQKLFTYSTQDTEDKIEQAEIDIERDKSEIEQSQKSIEENEKLKSQVSSDELLSVTTEILSLENSIKQKEYEIKSKEREIEKLKESMENSTVTAEMAGIVQKINDSSSSDSYSYYYGSDSDSAYITILATGDFRIEGKVNEQNLQNIYVGMPMIVYSRVDSTVRWYGEISDINTDQTDDSSQSSYYYSWGDSGSDSSTYKFYVELDSSEGLILGQHVYMEENIGQEDGKDGLWLEEYYLTEEDGTSYVWMAGDDNTLKKQAVTLGEYDEDMMKYEILDGLTADDYIAFPMDDLTEGAPVIYNDLASDTDDSDDWDSEDMDSWDAEDMDSWDIENLDDEDMDSWDIEDMDDWDDGDSAEDSVSWNEGNAVG
jgi:HlyD family secretion protein